MATVGFLTLLSECVHQPLCSPAETALAQLSGSDHRVHKWPECPSLQAGWAGGQGQKGPAGYVHFPPKCPNSPVQQVLPLQGISAQWPGTHGSRVTDHPAVPRTVSVVALQVCVLGKAEPLVTLGGPLTL